MNEWLAKLEIPYTIDVRSESDEVMGTLRALRLRSTMSPPGKGKRARQGVVVSPSDVGFGIGQVLPIIIEGLTSRTCSIIRVEQPEIHLHPRLQAQLADFLIETSSASRGTKGAAEAIGSNQWIVETHSELLMLRIQRRIREGTLSHDDVSVIYVDPGRGLGAGPATTSGRGGAVHRRLATRVLRGRSGRVLDVSAFVPFAVSASELLQARSLDDHRRAIRAWIEGGILSHDGALERAIKGHGDEEAKKMWSEALRKPSSGVTAPGSGGSPRSSRAGEGIDGPGALRERCRCVGCVQRASGGRVRGSRDEGLRRGDPLQYAWTCSLALEAATELRHRAASLPRELVRNVWRLDSRRLPSRHR